MNKRLAVMATPGRTGCFHQPGDSASKETDPVVQGRADIKPRTRPRTPRSQLKNKKEIRPSSWPRRPRARTTISSLDASPVLCGMDPRRGACDYKSGVVVWLCDGFNLMALWSIPGTVAAPAWRQPAPGYLPPECSRLWCTADDAGTQPRRCASSHRQP